MAIAWWFPGQGTQKVGMGAELAEQSAAAREVFHRADEALGESLSELIFNGPSEKLTLTENAQPAILATSIALLAALKEASPNLPEPDFAAGHSLGEYSALVAAGALTFEDAIRLVRVRGRAMQSAVGHGTGGMAAILGGTQADVEALCRDVTSPEHPISPANFNAPGQIVVAGTRLALERAQRLAGERRMKAILLEVSAPFHSQLMIGAIEALDQELARIDVARLRFPVVSNLDATPNRNEARVRELLNRQVSNPVLWQQSVEWMTAQGLDRALEIGPGRVLAGLARKIAPHLKVHNVNDSGSALSAAAFLAS